MVRLNERSKAVVMFPFLYYKLLVSNKRWHTGANMSNRTATNEDGKTVAIGDWVEFKCDTEQCGRIVGIEGTTLVLKNEEGFSGDYIGGDTTTRMDAGECY